MEFPKPPGMTAEPAPERITANDVSLIVSAELHPAHRDDPTVLKFINTYLVTRDLRESAEAAGINIREAKVLRNRRDIHNAIVKVTETAVLKYGLDPNEIVEKVKDVAFFDPIDLVNEDGSVKGNLHDIPASARRAIKSIKIKNVFEPDINGIKVKTGYITEITMWDKMKAVEFLGREEGLFKETKVHQHDVTKDMKDTLLGGLSRAEERMERLRNREEIDVSPNSKTVSGDTIRELGDGRDNGSNGDGGSGIFEESANTIRVSGGEE